MKGRYCCRACAEADRLALERAERIKAEDFAADMDRLRAKHRADPEMPVAEDAEYRSLFQMQPSMDTRGEEVGGAMRGCCTSCPGTPAHPHHDKP